MTFHDALSYLATFYALVLVLACLVTVLGD